MVNVFEAVDVITIIKGGNYDDLTLPVGEALQKRSPVCAYLTYLTLSFSTQADLVSGLPWNLHMFS